MPSEEKDPPANSSLITRVRARFAQAKETTGKLITLGFSKLPGRLFAIATTSLALAGIAGPFIPVAAVPILIAGIGTAVAGIVADTLQVRNTRLLQKENRMLLKYQGTKLSQEQILNKYPKLNAILKDKLSAPKRENQKSITERYSDPSRPRSWFSRAMDASVAIRDNSGTLTTFVKSASKGGIENIGKALFTAAYTIIAGEKRQDQTGLIKNTLEKQIDELRGQKNISGYNSLTELRNNLREQRIEQLALTKLTSDPKYTEMIDLAAKGKIGSHRAEIKIKETFEALKIEIAQREKAISVRSLLSDAKSYMMDLKNAHDPFSQYYDLNKGGVEISHFNQKTSQIEKTPFKEFDKASKQEKKAAKFEKKVQEKVERIIHTLAAPRNTGKHVSSKVKHTGSRHK